MKLIAFITILVTASFIVQWVVLPAQTIAAGWAKTANGKYYKMPPKEEGKSDDSAPQATSQQDIAYKYYRILYNHILRTSPSMGEAWADSVARTILHSSAKYKVDPLLATALFTQESGFNNAAISSTGALGISQLMPSTADYLNVDPYDPVQNIDGGVKYLAEQLNRYQSSGDWRFTYAIAAYNAGPNAINQYGGIPPYQETINHVKVIGGIYQKLVNELQLTPVKK